MDYIRRLGVEPKDGVYTFTFDEGNAVHDQLVGDLAMEFAMDVPKDGDAVKITVRGKKVTDMKVEEDPGLPGGKRRRRSRLNKKTRRAKGKRGNTKRR
jgi:hypothetical protein